MLAVRMGVYDEEQRVRSHTYTYRAGEGEGEGEGKAEAGGDADAGGEFAQFEHGISNPEAGKSKQRFFVHQRYNSVCSRKGTCRY